MRKTIAIKTPIASIWPIDDEGICTEIRFNLMPTNCIYEETPFLLQIKQELLEYFEGTRREFTIPVRTHGTPFQMRVWEALKTIPYGETVSYQHIATLTGDPKAVRAVGLANKRNRLPILIPCHRVIAKDGRLVGYNGGLNLKELLITHERKYGPVPKTPKH
ncbi:MAG: methylated-DNA--[protein]-cysteine S-methyltransferase [Bacilli bacterium]|jgi:methylated-DNA-[protein]-cysteine S-methyltransferase|nr:methylated-DNA--[protein]-cysteine S-methyltransferase [Bacilli bacterium]